MTRTPIAEAPDYSMLSRRWSGQKLISADLAVAIARQIHKEQYGQTTLDEDEPLSVSDDGDCWIVNGGKKRNFEPKNLVLDGPLRMRISKFDGQILSYLFAIALPRPGQQSPREER
jgi:NTF2 fold immunity protein